MGKHDRSRKKNYINFYNRQIFFSKTRIGFRHWVTGITNPTTGIYYDMIFMIIDGLIKYVKFVLCKTIMTTEKLTKLFLEKNICGSWHSRINH